MSMFAHHPKQTVSDSRKRLMRSASRPALIAGVIGGVFFGLGGIWATTAPLASASLAAGSISPEGHRKTIQHLEGGIVREITVTDGDRIQRGDVLLILEDTQALAAFRAQETRFLALKAMEARLHSEQAATLPDWDSVPRAPGRDEVIRDQKRILETTEESLRSQQAILDQRIKQIDEEIAGLVEQIASDGDRLDLLAEEISMMQQLVKKGLARKPPLLELQRLRAEVAGQLAGNKAAVARAKQSIGETQLEIIGLNTTRRDEAANRLSDIRAELADLEEKMSASRDVLTRTVLEAPLSGTVFNLQAKTEGGVIRPGEAIMDIVPDGDDLLVDARVPLTDIDVVAIGLEAEVTLSAFPQRNLPKLKGIVRQVAADRMTDDQTGEVFYLARIEIKKESLALLGPEIELVPGMPADAMIFTGAQTFFDYLIGPLLDSIDRSFRES